MHCVPQNDDVTMIGHNRQGWEMPGEFENYVKLFNEADSAARALNVATGDLGKIVTMINQSPHILSNPAGSGGRWPSQEELRQLYADFRQKSAPLQAAWNQLPADVKGYAPAPSTVGKGQKN